MKVAKMPTILAVAVLAAASCSTAWADTFVRGYKHRNGTFVQQHWRTNPDRTRHNNYSFPGNVNPHTGRVAPGNSETYLRNRLGGGNRR